MLAGWCPGTETVYVCTEDIYRNWFWRIYACTLSSLLFHFLLHATCFAKARPTMHCLWLFIQFVVLLIPCLCRLLNLPPAQLGIKLQILTFKTSVARFQPPSLLYLFWPILLEALINTWLILLFSFSLYLRRCLTHTPSCQKIFFTHCWLERCCPAF
jgi:hypothetical protein